MTTPLYALDAAESQKIYEDHKRAEQQRYNELIEKAVSSFAPHLANQDDVSAVHLYSANNALRSYFRTELCAGSKIVLVEHCKADGRERKGRNEVQQDGAEVWLDIPKKADLVATKSALNSRVELLAAQLNALPVCLPEAADYVLARLKKQGALVIVGADQGRRS